MKVLPYTPRPPVRVMRLMQDATRDLYITHAALAAARAKGLVFYELTNGLWMTESPHTTLNQLEGSTK